jgi:hypothetical protein
MAVERKLQKAPLSRSVVPLLLLAACSSVPRIPATGTFAGEVIQTTVDSEVARYYLEDYLQGKRGAPALHDRIDALTLQYHRSLPSREELAGISRAFSVDFASLFFANRLLNDECNRQLNQSFSRYRLGKGPARANARYAVLFVPGWDYVANGSLTGADFAAPRQLATAFGLENRLVALPPTGSVEGNAAVLADEIARYAATGKRIILVGASSAGPTIHLALGELLSRNEAGAIRAWLNLGGLLQGTPVVDYFQGMPQAWLFDTVVWWNGWDREAVASMGTGPSRKRFARLRIDAGILTINYLGVPLSGQLSRYSADTYPLLKSQGPNDGLTLLADAIAPGSLTLVAMGSDHFFAEDPHIDAKTVALMALLVSMLEGVEAMPCR